ncbi:hypothetical protein [Cyanobium sp. ULC084]
MIALTPVGLALLTVAILFLLFAPRRWAPVPVLIVTCYLPLVQGVMLGSLSFYAIRILILAGFVRIFIRGEYHGLSRSPLDMLMLVWSIWALVASAFRIDPGATLIGNGGTVFNSFGTYILLRVFCRTPADVVFLCRVVAWLLVPVALEMVYERLAANNLFSLLGGVPEVPEIRQGRIRAQGPFAHSILAGTVGAAMLPVCLGLWRRHRSTAIIGALASAMMVFACASSGPLMSTIFATIGLLLWHMRTHLRTLRWTFIFLYVFLMAVMKAPPYYLIGRIDLAGGSTGWHRARLIESSLEHLGEWWLAGTDYTRHWMPTGVAWSPDHADITNQYIQMGVVGGLPLMLMFIFFLAMAFSIVGRSVSVAQKSQPEHAFLCWALGASLFAHATTFFSVAYFDQSIVFLYITTAAIAVFGAPEFVNGTARPAKSPLWRVVYARVHRTPKHTSTELI